MSRRDAPPPDDEPDLLASPLAWDKDAERALVGYVLTHPDRAAEIVSAAVSPDDFHGYAARSAFTCIAALVARAELPDMNGLVRELHAQQIADVSAADVVTLTDGIGIAVNWQVAAARVREGASRRKLAQEFAALIRRAGVDPIEDLRRDAYELLDTVSVAMRPASADRWACVASEIGARYDAPDMDRVPSGIYEVDLKLGAVPRGSLALIGARTSVGKTSLATTLAAINARAGLRVSFVSREMDRRWIGRRMVGAMTGLPVRAISERTLGQDELDQFAGALREDLPLCIDDKVKTWSQARARIRQHARELGGLDLAYVDYVQLLDPEPRKGENRYEAIGRMSAGMKDLAGDLGCCLWACAQLGRGAEDRPEPRLSDFRESGNLEQDADVCWLIWVNPKDRPVMGGTIPVRLRVAKYRNSSTNEFKVHFQKSATRFLEFQEDEEETRI